MLTHLSHVRTLLPSALSFFLFIEVHSLDIVSIAPTSPSTLKMQRISSIFFPLVPLVLFVLFSTSYAQQHPSTRLNVHALAPMCTKKLFKQICGCICYLRFIKVLVPFDNKSRQSMYCKKGLNLSNLASAKRFCRPFFLTRKGKQVFDEVKALRGIQGASMKCNQNRKAGKGSINMFNELPKASKYRHLL